MATNPIPVQSYLAEPVIVQNFSPAQSGLLAVGASSASITFSAIVGTLRITAKITNKGNNGAYVATGIGSATAVASSSTPGPNCDYVGAGAILTQDYAA